MTVMISSADRPAFIMASIWRVWVSVRCGCAGSALSGSDGAPIAIDHSKAANRSRIDCNRGSSSRGTENRHKRKCVLNQRLAQTSVYGWPVWMRKPLGIFAFTNLFYEESEWQLVSESLSAEAYVGFLFPCYSTPVVKGLTTTPP